MKTFNIIKKNLKLIVRSRISALIILLGPLLIMLIVGLAFNSSSTVRINVGYYASSYSNLTESFVDVLRESNYKVNEYSRVEDCALSIVAGENHICLIFPEDFEIRNDRVNEVVFLVDNSKINFFETVVDSIEQEFNDRALVLSQGLTQELLDRLNETKESISERGSVIDNMKTENSNLKKDVSQIGQEVSNLDLNFDLDDLGIKTLESQTGDLAKNLHDVQKIAENAIDESLELIDDVDAEIRPLNISNRDDILTMLNDTAEEMEDFLEDLNDSTSKNTSKLDDIVDDLKDDLKNVEHKFGKASDARDISVDKIKSINQKLNQSLAKIIVVEQTFKAITSNIQGTEITDLDAITNPIVKRVEPVVTDTSTLNFFFPYLVVLIIMFIGLLLSCTLVIMEKTSRAHFRNFVTPTSDLTFVMGTYITTISIMILQLLVVLSLYSVYFKEDLTSNLSSNLLVLGLLVTLFSWIGMTIGNVFNTEETGTLASISVGSILLFISDLVFPLERMPDTVAHLARTYNPFVVGTELLRKTIVLKIPANQIGNDLLLVVAYLAIFFTLMMLSHKLMKRSYLLRWGGYIARRELRLEKQTQTDSKMLEIYRKVPEKDWFTTKEDHKIPNLKELVEFIENMNENHYKEYVYDNENTFADWIDKVLLNENLGLKVRTAKSKSRMLSAMKQGIKQYEKLEHKHSKKKK